MAATPDVATHLVSESSQESTVERPSRISSSEKLVIDDESLSSGDNEQRLIVLDENEEKKSANETVERLIRQRRASTLTALGALVKKLFMEKKQREDGIPAEIIEGLFLGSIGAALNVEWLLANEITHVLCVANQIRPQRPDAFTYKTIEILDAPDAPLMDHFEETSKFIDLALEEGKILVHCFAGMSRSVTVVSAYLMKTRRISAINALKFVKSKREQSNPNPGFIVQLIKYQGSLGIPYKKSKKSKKKLKKNSTDGNESEDTGNDVIAEQMKQVTLTPASSEKSEAKQEPNPGCASPPALIDGDSNGASLKAKDMPIDSALLKSWDRGKRPSIFSAIAKLNSFRTPKTSLSERDTDTEFTDTDADTPIPGTEREISLSQIDDDN